MWREVAQQTAGAVEEMVLRVLGLVAVPVAWRAHLLHVRRWDQAGLEVVHGFERGSSCNVHTREFACTREAKSALMASWW